MKQAQALPESTEPSAQRQLPGAAASSARGVRTDSSHGSRNERHPVRRPRNTDCRRVRPSRGEDKAVLAPPTASVSTLPCLQWYGSRPSCCPSPWRFLRLPHRRRLLDSPIRRTPFSQRSPLTDGSLRATSPTCAGTCECPNPNSPLTSVWPSKY